MTQEQNDQTMALEAKNLELEWGSNPRWEGVTRDYKASDVVKLRGRVSEEHTLARRGSEKLWKQLTEEHKTGGYTNALGALTGNQAVKQVKAGLRAIYLSGWQVAADANNSGHTYPDQSLYPTCFERRYLPYRRSKNGWGTGFLSGLRSLASRISQ